jgi:hypothetical protein
LAVVGGAAAMFMYSKRKSEVKMTPVQFENEGQQQMNPMYQGRAAYENPLYEQRQANMFDNPMYEGSNANQ